MAIHNSITTVTDSTHAPPQPRAAPKNDDLTKTGDPHTETTEINVDGKEDSTDPPEPYCGMNVMNSPSSYRALSPPISMVHPQNSLPQPMANLRDIPIRPLSRYVNHWLGVQINTISLVENIRLVRYQASLRLQRL